jgi:hypothetical protein
MITYMKQWIIVGLLGVAAVLAFIVYGLVQPPAAMVQTDTVTVGETLADMETDESEITVDVGEGSLALLAARGEDLECTITYTDPSGVSVSGTYFTHAGAIRGDFVTESDGQEIVSSVIVEAQMMHTWSEIDGEAYGMKVDLAALPEGDEQALDTREPVPLEASVSYSCLPWGAVDRSIFVPPGDILFTDYSTIMQQGMEFGTSFESGSPTESDPCALCAQVPAGAAQDQCLVNFGCN